MNENRARIKEENPEFGFGDIARKVAAEFKALDADAKKVYEEKAQKDKKRYEKAMESYTPPAGMETAKGKKGKAKKDPNAPKRGQSSFMVFSNAVRSKVKEENPEASFGQLGKLIGEKFKALSSEERAKYDALAKKDKQRYEKEMTAYQAKKKGDEEDDAGSDDSDSD